MKNKSVSKNEATPMMTRHIDTIIKNEEILGERTRYTSASLMDRIINSPITNTPKIPVET